MDGKLGSFAQVVGVSVSPELVMGIVGLIVTLFAQGIVIVRVLDAKAERRMSEMEQRHSRELDGIRKDIKTKDEQHSNNTRDLHGRIESVKDQYVKKEDHDKDITLIRESLTDFRREMKMEMSAGIEMFNKRIMDLHNTFTHFLTDIASKIKDK